MVNQQRCGASDLDVVSVYELLAVGNCVGIGDRLGGDCDLYGEATGEKGLDGETRGTQKPDNILDSSNSDTGGCHDMASHAGLSEYDRKYPQYGGAAQNHFHCA